MSAPSRPCSTRDAISMSGDWANAHSSDAAAKPTGADHEHAFAAVQVAEPAAGDETDRHRERVTGAEPLDHAVGAAEVGTDGRAGDRGDERVEQVHDLGGQDDEQRHPPPAERRCHGLAWLSGRR